MQLKTIPITNPPTAAIIKYLIEFFNANPALIISL
jgi:hypothetical protein